MGKMRILLVEDNSDHRELMRLALTGHDSTWEVEAVASGEEALRLLLGGEVFDLVFLDYSLPGRDGLEVLEEIRRGEAPPPVVVVTGRGDEQVAVKAMKGGAYDYVVKQAGYLERLPVVARHAMDANRLAMERKRAEEALRLQNELLRTILDSIPVMVALFDREGHYQLVNRFWQSTLGWSLEKAQYKDVLAELYPDPAYRKYVVDYIAAAAGTWSDFKTRTRDGRVLDTSWVNVPLSEGSNIGIGIDITERKRAEAALKEREEKYWNLFNNAEVGIFRTRLDGSEVMEINRRFLDIVGMTLEETLGKPSVNLWADPKELEEMVKRLVEDGSVSAFEYRMLNKRHGDVRNCLTSLRLYREQGILEGSILDITERKQAEEALRASREQLRALAGRLQAVREEERTQIAREIHDEMGGGLTGLKMDLSWLLRKMGDADPGEERVALMDKIHTSNALIDQMIRVVRRISTDLRPSVLDDLGLIAALEWQLSEFTSRTEISHEFATTVEYVNMDEDTAVAVFRIFQEALTNVVRHSRATKVAVFLREGERSLFGDESLVLEIRDNGRGITEEEILNPESLGLLGMKERVLTFGGELSIRGEPGGGTALVLKIPRKQGEAS
jgi:two-component system sensor histidine kinase UhpB